ncbi:MAG: hypothetical protein PCFJNLEI_04150 [Verrucomicrobiae bacterium]|nr:hypothetical protein [Verrucomicrobiae bacterium]
MDFPPRFHVLPCKMLTVLFDEAPPLAYALPMTVAPLNTVALVTVSVLNLAQAPLPTEITPVLVTKPPLTIRVLPVAAPLPMFTVCPNMFQIPPLSTLAVLFDDPLPMVTTPPLSSVVLVTVIRLNPLPAPPTVTAPLEAIPPPSTLK